MAPHLEVFTMLTKNEGDTNGRTHYKKQNNYLMKVLFDETGECAYHVDCILRTFKISKGRLKRLQERIKREMRGELTRHGLYGRPSNNRKKTDASNISAEDDNLSTTASPNLGYMSTTTDGQGEDHIPPTMTMSSSPSPSMAAPSAASFGVVFSCACC